MLRGKKPLAGAVLFITLLIFLTLFWTAVAANDNSGIFLPFENHMTGSWPEAVAIGDVNSDGLKDVVMTTSYYFDPVNDHRVFVFLQNSQGKLDAPVKYQASGTQPQSVAIGDVTGDGRNDVVVGNSGLNVEVFPQNDQGALIASVKYPTTNSNKIKLADLNHDGRLDVVGIGWGTDSADVLLQNPGGTLNTPVSYSVTHGGYDDLDVGDVNNDGLQDVVVMSGQGYANPNIGIMLQKTDGTLSAPEYYSLGGNKLAHAIAVGDINGDGLNDVVVSYGGNRPESNIAVFLQNGSGKLDPPASYGSPDIPEPLKIADVNADGRQDVVVAHGGWNTLSVFLQQSGGVLLPYEQYSLPYASHYNPQGMDVGDLNNDSHPDVAIADYNNGLVVLYGACDIKPYLSLGMINSYWASYSDYETHTLSVNYSLSAPGATAGDNVNIIGSVSSGNVSLASDLPVALGNISAGSGTTFILKYQVPNGVGSFRTAIYATAQDACGKTYQYPVPFPGS